MPGLQDVTSDLQMNNPQVNVEINRDKAAALGVSRATDGRRALQRLRRAPDLHDLRANNQYQVIMELEPQYARDPTALSMLYVRSKHRPARAARRHGHADAEVGPLTMKHLGQLPAVTISFNLKPGASLGDAIAAVERAARNAAAGQRQHQLPGHRAGVRSRRMQGLGVLLIIAILVIYMVLGILYESFIHPLTILSGLPFAGFGALLTLLTVPRPS